MKKIEKFFILIVIPLLMVGCCSTKPTIITPKEEVKVIFKDSIVIKDSIILTPIEMVADVNSIYDTLRMETSLAKSSSWIDTTTNSLKGFMENKKQFQQTERIIEKYIERTDTIKIVKHEPYPIPEPYVPTIYKYALIFSIIVILLIFGKIYSKIKGGLF